ncbi:MAG: imidazolonepropionase [Chitinophagaceae bacterium]|nr:MAG: imidazolonepropionase [Chitinophagaceae bacterium]
MRILIKNIKQLVQVEAGRTSCFKKGKEAMQSLPVIQDACLIIENGVIADFGNAGMLVEKERGHFDQEIDAKGGFVLPCWCDSHTHLVFAKSREEEFVDRIKGSSYEEIAQRGGGILHSAAALHKMPEEELYDLALARLETAKNYGTGAIEIKSGYGLSVEGELKMLRVIRKLKENADLIIKATFLGAHAYPPEYRSNRKGYVQLIMKKMLPQIADEGLADYIDVFCEKGFFSLKYAQVILETGLQYGLKIKMHTNQMNSFGGVQLAAGKGALSVDHLERMTAGDIKCLSESFTMGTLLPASAFFLNNRYPPARALIDQGVIVALASDYNPGSSPSLNMQFVVSLACIKMKMLPEEALNAATLNGAAAMEVENQLGSITRGKKANVMITKPIPSLPYLPYSFGENLISRVILNGKT